MLRGRGRRAWRDTPVEAPVIEAPVEEPNNLLPSPLDVKMVDASDGMSDNEMPMEGEEEKTRKRPWEKPGGVKVKRKKVPGAKNLKIRRYVQPKNAVMCLNELRPGVVYTTEQEGGVSQPFCVSVEVAYSQVDNQKYRGFGTSKQLAKQAAAEAALISFVKPPVVAANAKEAKEEDKTPWATLASFAIYKLFNDWRDGRVGMCPPPAAQPYGTGVPPGFTSFLASAAEKEEAANAAAFTEAISAHLGGRAPHGGPLTGAVAAPMEGVKETVIQNAEGKVPKPAKQVPENAAAMHPVMVLHQMKPGIQYDISQLNKDGKLYFEVSCTIDEQNFTGEGPNVKKAKFNLAKSAILGLYGVESAFEPPSS
ncbi:double-stranded RNA-specific editase 1-like isoform X2 [Macrobrachium nipponense]|uniref:double-stranded RNA-specific editase 1-like isoform X2 n=1 Tax=Macrobrachium nipponense TaxID=159736 RepID=UPI0030C7EEC6